MQFLRKKLKIIKRNFNPDRFRSKISRALRIIKCHYKFQKCYQMYEIKIKTTGKKERNGDIGNFSLIENA